MGGQPYNPVPGLPAMPSGPGGRYKPFLPNPPPTRRQGTGDLSVEFWLVLVIVALFLATVFVVYKFHVRRTRSKAQSQETVSTDAWLGSRKLKHLLACVWVLSWLLLF